jgi:serine/threonine protein kinase
MQTEDLVDELLVRWEANPALTPEELCDDFRGRPEHGPLLEAIRQGMRDLQAAAPFLDTQADSGTDSPAAGNAETPHRTTSPASSAGGAVSGRYRPRRFHGRGGQGEVHVAEDTELGREVALKRIQGRYADDDEIRRRFLREAEITARLQHPGIVPVYGLVHDDQGRPSYAMRFIEGDSLKDAIAHFHGADRAGRDAGERNLALRALLAQLVAVCKTMAYAHSRGIIHRDLKPGNIMLGQYGEALVVDWGLARPFA